MAIDPKPPDKRANGLSQKLRKLGHIRLRISIDTKVSHPKQQQQEQQQTPFQIVHTPDRPSKATQRLEVPSDGQCLADIRAWQSASEQQETSTIWDDYTAMTAVTRRRGPSSFQDQGGTGSRRGDQQEVLPYSHPKMIKNTERLISQESPLMLIEQQYGGVSYQPPSPSNNERNGSGNGWDSGYVDDLNRHRASRHDSTHRLRHTSRPNNDDDDDNVKAQYVAWDTEMERPGQGPGSVRKGKEVVRPANDNISPVSYNEPTGRNQKMLPLRRAGPGRFEFVKDDNDDDHVHRVTSGLGIYTSNGDARGSGTARHAADAAQLELTDDVVLPDTPNTTATMTTAGMGSPEVMRNEHLGFDNNAIYTTTQRRRTGEPIRVVDVDDNKVDKPQLCRLEKCRRQTCPYCMRPCPDALTAPYCSHCHRDLRPCRVYKGMSFHASAPLPLSQRPILEPYASPGSPPTPPPTVQTATVPVEWQHQQQQHTPLPPLRVSTSARVSSDNTNLRQPTRPPSPPPKSPLRSRAHQGLPPRQNGTSGSLPLGLEEVMISRVPDSAVRHIFLPRNADDVPKLSPEDYRAELTRKRRAANGNSSFTTATTSSHNSPGQAAPYQRQETIATNNINSGSGSGSSKNRGSNPNKQQHVPGPVNHKTVEICGLVCCGFPGYTRRKSSE